jgi:flagellar biosynthesis/type III secretory pathway protein FliH
MTDAERIADLERQLQEERAYSEMLEVKIDMEVDKRIDEATKEAEQRGYDRGIKATGEVRDMETMKSIDRQLQDHIVENLAKTIDEAVPEDLREVIKASGFRPTVRVETYEKPDTFSFIRHAQVLIPATVFQVAHEEARY